MAATQDDTTSSLSAAAVFLSSDLWKNINGEDRRRSIHRIYARSAQKQFLAAVSRSIEIYFLHTVLT
jgi:hypothetical protein